MEHVLDHANKSGIDAKNAGYLVDRDLKKKLEAEAIKLRMLDEKT